MVLKLRNVYSINVNGNDDKATLVSVYHTRLPHSQKGTTEYVFRNSRGKHIKITDKNRIKELNEK